MMGQYESQRIAKELRETAIDMRLCLGKKALPRTRKFNEDMLIAVGKAPA